MSDTSGAVIEAAPVAEAAPTEVAPEVATGGAGEGTPPIVEAPASGEPIEGAAPEGEPTVPAAPDWGTKVTEWGGEAEVERAVRLSQALTTQEGIRALYIEAAKALGMGEAAALEQLGGAPAGEVEESIEDLMADPTRQLTVAEFQRLNAHYQQQQQAQSFQQAEMQRISAAVTSTMTELKVDPTDQAYVLAQADALLGPVQGSATDAQIKDAITRAQAQFEKRVADRADGIVSTKATVAEGLPNPLPATAGGAGSAATPDAEPGSVAEARKNIREQFKEAFARPH